MVLLNYQPHSPGGAPAATTCGGGGGGLTMTNLSERNNNTNDGDPSSHSLADLEELLMEAGLTTSLRDRPNHHDGMMNSSSNSLHKSMKEEDDEDDGSFLTAAQLQERESILTQQSTSSTEDDGSITTSNGSTTGSSTDVDDIDVSTLERGCCELRGELMEEHQQQPIVAPAAPGEEGDERKFKNIVDVDELHRTLTAASTSTTSTLDDDTSNSNIPVIALDRLELLQYKARRPDGQRVVPPTSRRSGDDAAAAAAATGTTTSTRDAAGVASAAETRSVGLETRSMETRSVVDTIVSQDDDGDQHSVTSVQSLISVVAELIAIPVRIATAFIADLEQEVVDVDAVVPLVPVPSARPERAEFISVGILKSPIDMDSLGLTLVTDTTKDGKKQILVIQKIDSNGPWSSSPLCTGDRIVSMNHVPVSHWAPEAVDNYWSTLTDSVTVVAHNPTGDAQKVAVMITKPDPSSRTGLGMRSSRPGRIKISRVSGLFADTLVSPGDLILSINDKSVEGHNSSDTAAAILQSPKYVTIIAKSSHQNAFVISTNQRPSSSNNSNSETNSNRNNNSSNQGDTTRQALLNNNTNTTEGRPSTSSSSNPSRGGGGANQQDSPMIQLVQPRPELDETDRCDNCGCAGVDSLQTIKAVQWIGNFYVALLVSIGMYLCFDQQLGLSFVMGVLVLSLVMANIININIRQVQRRLIDKERRWRYCTTFQLSANIIVIAAFTFLILMCKHLEYTPLTMEFVIASTILILVPMLLFINLPSLCLPPPANPEDFDYDHHDHSESAFASLASQRF